MKANEIATKSDIEQSASLILNKLAGLTKEDAGHIGYISYEAFKEQTGLADATIWRLENRGVLTPRRFQGSNKKFYRLSEIQAALEAGKK